MCVAYSDFVNGVREREREGDIERRERGIVIKLRKMTRIK